MFTRVLTLLAGSAWRIHQQPRASLYRLTNHRSAIPLALGLLLGLLSSHAAAAPEARLLRIDPRASTVSGSPIITTVIEVQQSKRVSQATAHCATQRGNALLSCIAQALEKPLYQTFPFPKENAIFSINVDDVDRPAALESVQSWGKSQREPGVGTAWLILIDADSRMSTSFRDARQLAAQFVKTMGPNDIVNLMYFNDRQVFADSGWIASSSQERASQFIDQVTSTMAVHGRNRPLLTIIKNAATDAFKALGNTGDGVEIPLHQAMVVLSTGFGGADPSTTGPGAMQLSEYMTNGRFPENNTVLPKTPVPVISIYFPARTWDEFSHNSLDFMQNLANPQIGGFFNIMQAGEASSRAGEIVKAVRTRFSKMYLAKWRVSCIAPTITQTFRLVFKDVNPPIMGDASFQDVPIGIDPTTWPLDINVKRTQQSADEGVYPGGTFKVFGDFCWGGDSSRAEVYFLPAGQSLPTELKGHDAEQAKQTQQQLIAMGMRGEALQTADTFVEFRAPDNDKLIHGSGSQAVARLVLYDNKARRMSGVTAETILQIPARSAPFPLVLVLGALLAITVVALLVVIVVRSGNKRNHRAPAGGPPAPRVPTARTAPQPPTAPRITPAPDNPTRAVLRGAAGVFTITPDGELRAGRDGARCAILLTQPQVSSAHATVKMGAGQLWVRDDGSNNGTFVDETRVTSGQWTVVPHGSKLRFGPEEFTVVLQ